MIGLKLTIDLFFALQNAPQVRYNKHLNDE